MRSPIVILTAVSLVASSLLAAPSELVYQDRGDRHEGVRDEPIAGTRIELLAAMADLPAAIGEPPDGTWPERLHVRFCLERGEPVFLTVRELDAEHFYWLDRVDPERWRTGCDNEYSWPSDAVLTRLPGLAMADLGVVARLGNRHGDLAERVAPVIFHRGAAPERVERYLFVFATKVSKKLTARLHRPGIAEPATIDSGFAMAGRPHVIVVDLAGAPWGEYRLVLEGEGISKIVTFYHCAAVC